ncbi:MAG: YkgJ family cysteine cluster protein [Candidatus Lokiarchaeota archaeon]|nr:YkgJ family cysteine cluster protein [Candidatus Lokiarchaeota archaeon]
MESPKEFRFQCTQCGNCCSDKNTIVNVTFHDILRIKSALDLTLDETLVVLGFYMFEKPPTSMELKKMVVPPIETENGMAFLGLFKQQSGSCYFYDEKNKKCRIYTIRPLFCRTFPYSFKILVDPQTKQRKGIEIYFTDKGHEYCEGINEKNPLIDRDKWVQLGKETIKQMEENNVLIQKWNRSVKNGEIIASARNFVLTILNLEKDSSS